MVQIIQKEVPIVAGVEVNVNNAVVTIEGPGGTLTRDLWYPNIEIRVEQDKVYIGTSVNKKTQKSIVGTYASHVANMISGVAYGFQYKLKSVYSHFPIPVSYTHLRAHETDSYLVCRLLLEKTKNLLCTVI